MIKSESLAPIEALRDICKSSHCVSESLRKNLTCSQVTAKKSIVYEEIHIPTPTEMCSELSNYLFVKIEFKEGTFYHESQPVIGLKNGSIYYARFVSPKLNSMLGRFYRGYDYGNISK